MSVTLNPEALARLLEPHSIPMMRAVAPYAEAAADALQGRIDQIMFRAAPSERPQAGVLFTNEGAIIGMDPQAQTSDRIANYLGNKLGVFGENWWIDVGETAAREAPRGSR